MKLLLLLLLFTSNLFGSINILDGIYDVKFKGGTATASFDGNLPSIVLIGQGDGNVRLAPWTIPDLPTWVFPVNTINESDLTVSSNRFLYPKENVFTMVGSYNQVEYNFNFIKWQENNPRLRLVEVSLANTSQIPEPLSIHMVIWIVSLAFIVFRNRG